METTPIKETTMCTCPSNSCAPSGCVDCPEHGAEAAAECEAQQKSEIDAENAWLRAAEAGGPADWAEEQRERELEAFYGTDFDTGLGEILAEGA